MNQSEIRTALAVGLLYIVRMLGLFMVLPVLPLVADQYQLNTPLLLGFALGAYGMTQALLQIPLGILSDRVGRKPIILGGLMLFVLGSLVAAYAETIYGVIAGRLLQGCGAIASTLLALVADLTRIEHRGKAMAIVGISIGGSFGLALILGPLVNGYFGVGGVFLFCALAGVVGLFVTGLIPTPRVRSHNPDANVNPALVDSLLHLPDLRRTLVGIFMLHYLLMGSFVILPPLLASTGRIAPDEYHLVYFWLLLAAFVAMMPFMWLSDRPAYTKLMLLAMIVTFAAASLIFSLAPGFYLLMVAVMLFFMAFNLLEVILPALVSKIAPAGRRGTAMGLYSTAQFAGGFAGGALVGLMLTWWDFAYAMYANAAFCVVWLVYAAGLSKPGNIRTITCRLGDPGAASTSEVTDALLSLDGVVDVALIEQDRLAYVKVNEDVFDIAAFEDLRNRMILATN
ncbi:MAG: MFS transporter [Pseudomonadota bacterium]